MFGVTLMIHKCDLWNFLFSLCLDQQQFVLLKIYKVLFYFIFVSEKAIFEAKLQISSFADILGMRIDKNKY